MATTFKLSYTRSQKDADIQYLIDSATTTDNFPGYGLIVQFNTVSASAPEPGTLALLALGIAGGIAIKRRK